MKVGPGRDDVLSHGSKLKPTASYDSQVMGRDWSLSKVF
jgi:hypothetical protein